ncbi:MAG: hypothetical protein E6H07_14325 [Bacteroidetes bacterium]|nr:MAG: hypothetical protein E6H07_14325 [Bacteroidota bacterium]
MKVLLILIFFIAPVIGNSKSIEKYYLITFKAEEYLFHNEFALSCKEYSKAFKTGFAFYADLRNAFKAGLLSGNDSYIKKFWAIIIALPEVANSIKNDPTIIGFCKPSMQQEILAYRKERQKTDFEKIIDSVILIDQKARRECRNNMTDTCKIRFKVLDSINLMKLYRLLHKTNYTEREFGYKTQEYIYLIALHARRWGYKFLDSLLKENIKKGRMKSVFFAHLISYRSDIDYVNKIYLNNQKSIGFDQMVWVVNNKVVQFNRTDSLIDLYNTNRKELFISKTENDILKHALITKNKLFAGCEKDLVVDFFRMEMSDQQFIDFLNNLRSKKMIKE